MSKTLAAAGAFFLLAAVATAQTIAGYDPANETSVSGIIRYVISTTGPDGQVGVHAELRTPDGPVRVHLGPALFIGMNNFSFFTDETIAIRGARVTFKGET